MSSRLFRAQLSDDVQRSIELLDKVLSEYDEHETEGEGDGGGDCSGDGDGDGDDQVNGGGGSGGGGGGVRGVGDVGDCGSSTEPSIGLTPDDESPSLEISKWSRIIVETTMKAI
ncbi:PREDICTED: putative uncharacterized protein DDB_G0287183 [Dufourea novaeangliae]|uniref:putative uncharacterized protein DDB_G0287183 n=1 Tax=Dufourea novaeangliae TaxID=178035 RepID=UPI0007677129|nr:PREDICTED: putative uncharacterized protein DDB_G0287183 [Dufourea novaeangliae]